MLGQTGEEAQMQGALSTEPLRTSGAGRTRKKCPKMDRTKRRLGSEYNEQPFDALRQRFFLACQR
jgi:hypothetical protein